MLLWFFCKFHAQEKCGLFEAYRSYLLNLLEFLFYLYEIAFLSHQIINCFKKVHFVFSFDVSYNDEAYIFFLLFLIILFMSIM